MQATTDHRHSGDDRDHQEQQEQKQTTVCSLQSEQWSAHECISGSFLVLPAEVSATSHAETN